MLRRILPPLLFLAACSSGRPETVEGGGGGGPACSESRPCEEGSVCVEGSCVADEPQEPAEPPIWQRPTGPVGLGQLSAMLVTDDRIYLGSYGAMAVSTDGGITFAEAEGFPQGRVEELIEADGAVFARNIEGVLAVTRDGGNSWHAPAVQLSVATIRARGDEIFVTGMNGAQEFSFVRSTNGGRAWEAIPDVFASHLALGDGWLVVRSQQGFLRTEDGGATWTQLPEPPLAMAGFDVVLEEWQGALVALTDRPLQAFVSLDRGESWTTHLLSDEPSGASERWLVAADEGLFALTNGGRIFRLQRPDGSWEPAQQGIPEGAFVEAATGGTQGAHLAWRGALYRFDGAAGAWQPAEVQVVRTAIAEVAVDGETVWALVDGKLIHRSDDGGRSWEQVASPGTDVHTIRAIAAGEGKVWIGTWYHGILRSDDGGATWVSLAGAMPSVIGKPGEQPWGAEDLHYADGTLHAATWSMVHMGGSDGNFQYVGVGPIRSTDGGATWQEGAAGLPAVGPDGRGGQLRSAGNRIVRAGAHLFLSTYGSGIFRSTDDGASWEEAGRGMPGGMLDATAELLDLVEWDGALYAAVGVARDAGSGLVHSTDGGLTWRPLPGAPPGPCAVRALARVGDRLVVSWDRFGEIDANEGIWATADGGATWERIGEGSPALPVDNLAVAAEALLAGTDHNGVWRLPAGSLE